MDFFAHAIAQCGINQLMALDRTFAGKRGGHNHGGEVLAVAFDFDMGAVEAGGNIAFYEFWCGKHSLYLRNLYPRLSTWTASVDNTTRKVSTMPRLYKGLMSDWPKNP